MDNTVYHVDKKKYIQLKEQFKAKNLFIAELQGAKIQNIESYMHEVWENFKFPRTGFINYDAYLDWIRDLEWLNRDGYVMAVFDSDKFLLKNSQLKKEIIEDLSEVVLPWWQREVEQCVVGGRAKPFDVYLVD